MPAIGWGAAPWSFSVTLTVVLPPLGTALLAAIIDEFVGVATGWAKVTIAVGLKTRALSVVSVAV